MAYASFINPDAVRLHSRLTRELYLADVNKRIAEGKLPAEWRAVADRVTSKPGLMGLLSIAAMSPNR